MWSAVRCRTLSSAVQQWKQRQPGPTLLNRAFCSSSVVTEEQSPDNNNSKSRSRREFLNLEEVQKVLSDVKADDVQVIPVPKNYDFADYMVIATGRSDWHVRNIAQALIYKVKQKQKGAKRMLLPSVEGQEGGKWIVIDSGSLIIHALDEKVRAYYNLEKLWSSGTSADEQTQDLDKAFIKVRRKNNSKKRPQASA
ncbi:protein Iojap-related, mitochondrial [Coffea eugenioides]|uniref:Protein Iojap-related, mitochondrial n=1 Tax=Coffea arabica TaxID=13443 RepID=A0A6P6V9I9_COFAR|nr:protein Iojap-related, mitochondrial [Coffea arabica]XP_027153350.1 protein Iojap-related, mitochondrial [Coffea eugenioides]